MITVSKSLEEYLGHGTSNKNRELEAEGRCEYYCVGSFSGKKANKALNSCRPSYELARAPAWRPHQAHVEALQ
jgi:hypothetical protein